MAHFAELNSGNTVLRVVVISNNDVDANGGDLHEDAETFVENLLSYSSGGVVWKQTSYNNNFRKRFAGIGHTYDSTKDAFIPIKPYASWILDESTYQWQAPVTYPTVTEIDGLPLLPGDVWSRSRINWDEPNIRWIGILVNEDDPPVTTNYRWDATGLEWIEI